MKHIIGLIYVFLLLGLIPVAGQKTIQDPHAEVRNTGPFSALHISGPFEVYFSQAPQHALAVSCSDPGYNASIRTEVRGTTLYIDFQTNILGRLGNRRLRAYISAPKMFQIRANGASTILIDGVLNSDELDLSISGASDLKGQINTQTLKLQGNGSSDFVLSGKAENLRVSLSGSSDLKGYNLTVDVADIRVSGASDVQITVSKALKAEASGASNIRYKGDPVVGEVKTSGASSLKRM